MDNYCDINKSVDSYVPTTDQARLELLGFRREPIVQFINDRIKYTHRLRMSQHIRSSSCIQGFGGEAFVNREDEAYNHEDKYTKEIIGNLRCFKPCLLGDVDDLFACSLNPGPFKRIMCSFLIEAWRVNTNFSQPMQPKTFKVTCDAWLVEDIQWIPFRLAVFSQPRPTNTFEATINWAFFVLWENTDRRILNFPTFMAICYDCRKEMVLCQKRINTAFKLARKKKWTLEQTCYILDSITEEYFVTCRDHGRKTLAGKCENAERINKFREPLDLAYESDCVEVQIPE